MSERWMGKSSGWFPSFVDEIILYLIDEGNFVSFMIRAMDDESRGFIVDEDISVFEEYSRRIQFIVYRYSFIVIFLCFPYFQDTSFDIYIEHITVSELRTFGEFFSSYRDFFCTKGFIDFSEPCTWKNLSHVSIESLSYIVGGWLEMFHEFTELTMFSKLDGFLQNHFFS